MSGRSVVTDALTLSQFNLTLQVKQGPRPAEENQQQCHCSKVELDSSNCTTELLHNHPTESRDPSHNDDNGSIPHVVVAVTQPSEGSSSSLGKDGSLLSGGRRKALVKILVVAVAVCLVGVVLVLSVYLLGTKPSAAAPGLNNKLPFAAKPNHSAFPKVLARSTMVEGRTRFLGGSFTADGSFEENPSFDEDSLSNFVALSFQFQLDSVFKDSYLQNIYRSINVTYVSDDHLVVNFAVYFRMPQDVTKQMLQDVRNVVLNATRKDGAFGIFIFDRESIDIYLPDKPVDACEEIMIPVCTSMPYSLTSYPNVLGHKSQMAALEAGLNTLAVLDQQCYAFLQFYWCTAFAPPCVDGHVIPPCRRFCRNAKAKCDYVPESQPLWGDGCEELPDSDDPAVCVQEPRPEAPARCEKITSPDCQMTGYHTTTFPNLAGHHDQEWSRNYLYDVRQLADTFKCYELIGLFGCSILNPKCVESDVGGATYIPPCKTLCLEAKRHCEFFYEMLNAEWASSVNCSVLPDSTDGNVCVGGREVQALAETTGCKRDQFACDSDECIPHAWVCDGVADCADHADEANCAACGGGFQCDDHKCLNKTRVCNGVRDCSRGEDEQNCGTLHRSVFLQSHHRDLRLQGSNEFEGLVEVYDGITDKWFTVCSEQWRRHWSDEACMELYHRKSDGIHYSKISKHKPCSVVVATTPGLTLLQRLEHRATCSSGRAVYTSCGKSGSSACGYGDDWLPRDDRPDFSGFDLATGVWPWLVSLSGGPDDKFFCGGALLNAEWVLTAAHCLGHKNTTSGLTVAMGYTRMAPHAESRQRRTVRELKRHPGYHWMDTVHDVALLRLDTPVELNRYVGPVCLSTSELNLAGDSSCYVAGWGKTHTSADDYSSVAHMKPVELVPNNECRRIFEDAKDVVQTKVADVNICARGLHGPDACAGDSGGVLACAVGNQTNVWVAAGIVSWGVGCDPMEWDIPGVYTDIAKARQWIMSVINDVGP
ncbi:Transmembrane protease serine 13 [Lamellibrachia satsuma]|nr:Transmembrane protease serine 13 [Lamellibrachia satsuma]